MRILLVGINHRTAAIDLRERIALAGDRLDRVYDRISADFPLAECIILTTCNRTEIYIARPSHESPTPDQLLALLAETCDVPRDTLTAASIQRQNEQAVAHLLRVACGLDSMILGEPQVLGQIKHAYDRATARALVGPILHRVFQETIRTAKRTRSTTGIDAGHLSIGSIAVDFARRIFQRFDDKTIVGIGAGPIAKLTLRHLADLNPARLWLTNRSPDRARDLAQQLDLAGPNRGPRPFEDLDQLLTEADIILTATAAPTPLITADRFKPLIRRRRHRPLLIIDLAVPRDVQPAVAALRNVFLYNIDDLQSVAADTNDQRKSLADAAEPQLLTAANQTMAAIHNQDIGRTIRALRQRLHNYADAETARTLTKLAATDPQSLADKLPDALREHTHRLINKILHLPLSKLDQAEQGTHLGFYAAALHRLFGIEEHEQQNETQSPDTPAPDTAPDTPPAPRVPLTSPLVSVQPSPTMPITSRDRKGAGSPALANQSQHQKPR